jgi:hypothetical protein
MKTREQILKKIENEKQTLAGLKESASYPNQWYEKQIAVIDSRIGQLQWVLDNDDCISKVLDVGKVSEKNIEEFLEQSGYFQKDESGVYSYISENERHLINLKWVLDAYSKYIKANK